MARELDDYPTLRLRLKSVRTLIEHSGNGLAEAAQRAPTTYPHQPTMSAALLDLRDVQRRLAELLAKTPTDESEARTP